MRCLFVFFLILNILFKTSAQTNSIERMSLDSVLRDKAKFNIDLFKISCNRVANTNPRLSVFNVRNYWHITGVLKPDCYLPGDSILNSKVSGEYSLGDKADNVVFVSNKKKAKNAQVNIYVYKRFYYCEKLYVLIRIQNRNSYINTIVLTSFNASGNIESVHVQSFIF